jgi:hypothetical protein
MIKVLKGEEKLSLNFMFVLVIRIEEIRIKDKKSARPSLSTLSEIKIVKTDKMNKLRRLIVLNSRNGIAENKIMK